MNNYMDEYGVQNMSEEAQETLELMNEKLDTDCGDMEPLQYNDTDETSEAGTKGKENARAAKAHGNKCR